MLLVGSELLPWQTDARACVVIPKMLMHSVTRLSRLEDFDVSVFACACVRACARAIERACIRARMHVHAEVHVRVMCVHEVSIE